MFVVPLSRSRLPLSRHFERPLDGAWLDELFAPTSERSSVARSPAMDVRETESGYTVEMDLPGVRKSEVKVSIEGRRVSIRTEPSDASGEVEGSRLIHRERPVGRFERNLTLAHEIDQTASAARLEDGVLTLTLVKRSASQAAPLTVN